MTTLDEKYMQRTFLLARKGVGRVNPNPLVGAVIVKNDTVIGEGYHRYFGGPHAEIEALEAAAEPVEGATVYVNLEPCAHHGKTPPCAERIIREKVARVVVAMRDPNPEVSGRGIRMLREAGIEVAEGVLEEDASDLNRVFVKYITTGLPYVVLKGAMTLDGKIASRVGDSRWVSGEKARSVVHELRNEYRAIMVGVNTIIADDPSLTARRSHSEGRNPVRIITDSGARIPMDAHVVNEVEEAATIVAHTAKASEEKLKVLREGGVKTIESSGKTGQVSLKKLMKILGEQGIDGVLLEGGGILNFSALEEEIVDEVFMFIAPKLVGGEHAKTPVEGKGVDLMSDAFKVEQLKSMMIGEDIMIRGKISY
jgi:diaminohydroxyphosphoribosylaminopyrimidine deaminase/5-amino-6-(5-phosphoribosylamino)uracil reductase